MNDLTHCDKGHEYTEENSYFSPAGVRWCRACRTERAKKYHLENKYGLTLDIVDDMLRCQNGQCLICLDELTEERLTVDHDHETGYIRGLLCRHCNQGLGQFKDNAQVVRKAAMYLDTPQPEYSI